MVQLLTGGRAEGCVIFYARPGTDGRVDCYAGQFNRDLTFSAGITRIIERDGGDATYSSHQVRKKFREQDAQWHAVGCRGRRVNRGRRVGQPDLRWDY
jgi:hypothetical protein